jgi:shikimate kinase|tara:strand:- start:6801 stop:7313 length:513 start_codon:yes stop_codon:yes gene_type:complete
MNISLTGVRGTGKTTVSRLLAKKSDKKLFSTDEEIIKKTRLSIERFVKKKGWDKFREVESEVIEGLCEFDECIFDTGSGIVLRNENIINLKRNGLVILLTADLKTLVTRVTNRKKSTSIAIRKNMDNIKKVLEECEERYKIAADYAIDTSNLSPEEVCDLIHHYIKMELH